MVSQEKLTFGSEEGAPGQPQQWGTGRKLRGPNWEGRKERPKGLFLTKYTPGEGGPRKKDLGKLKSVTVKGMGKGGNQEQKGKEAWKGPRADK